MNPAYKIFRDAVCEVADGWLADGLPSRQILEESAVRLLRLRQELKIPGIWKHPPCMVTATLDDGSPLALFHELSPRQQAILAAGGVINYLSSPP